MTEGDEARLAVLETKVEQLAKDKAEILGRVDMLAGAVEKIKDNGIRMQVYVKALVPALSITLTVIGFLLGKFVI